MDEFIFKILQWGWIAMAGALAWFMKSFHDDTKDHREKTLKEIESIKKDHSNHQLHVAQNYLTNARADRMEEKIDKIYEAVVKK